MMTADEVRVQCSKVLRVFVSRQHRSIFSFLKCLYIYIYIYIPQQVTFCFIPPALSVIKHYQEV